MKLLIISNMAHYYRAGQLVGWGPTVQEINALAGLFDEIVHLGCLHPEQAPPSSLPYQSDRIRFIPLIPAGGDTALAKIDVLRLVPGYVREIRRWLPWADMAHVRCPANIPLVATIMLAFSAQPRYRWIKYAGNWQPDGKEAFTYTLQRWLLKRNIHRGVVTVNGKWNDQPGHVFTFANPCLTREELSTAQLAQAGKKLAPPYRLLFVGRLESAKGVGRILQLASLLKQNGLPFECDLVGDGPERSLFERQAQDLDLSSQVHFHGWLPRTDLGAFYSRAHFMLLPSSCSEGWPKVLSEAMAYGTMVVASDVSSIPQVLAETGAGVSIPVNDIRLYCQTIFNAANHPDTWTRYSQAGVRTANLFSYDHYLRALQSMSGQAWGITLKPLR